MNPPDFRSLCAELLDAFEHRDSILDHRTLITRARAALAQPVAEGPTDDELRKFIETLRNQWIVAVTLGGEDPDSDDFDRAIARAVLANWGRPAIPPIPVSERLPGEGDCDAEGRCWWFCPASFLPNGMCAYWCLAPADDPRSWHTHWAPHWALPLPAAPAAEPPPSHPQKPPLGLKPRWLAEEDRLREVADAINRCREAGLPPPAEWLDEHDDLGRKLQPAAPAAQEAQP